MIKAKKTLPALPKVGRQKTLEGNTVITVRLTNEVVEALAKKATGYKSRSQLLRTILTEQALGKVKTLPTVAKGNRTQRRDIYLNEEKYNNAKALARQQGFRTWQQWTLSLLEAAISNYKPLPPTLLKEIHESNYQLAAMGKNINQIARHINTESLKNVPEIKIQYDVLEEAGKEIFKHLKVIEKALDHEQS